MKDAFGGIVNIVLVAIFLVIVSGILGVVVNYTKAFRMKNVVISTIEQYEGAEGCFGNTSATGCQEKIQEKAKSFGYYPTELRCSELDGYKSAYNLFCYKRVDSDSGKNYVFTVITQVDINIPIINKLMGLSIFQVHGDTRAIRK
ncbi:MAG: hypothetical protein J6W64_06100 [Bacilli bacterium]|nr:hypothetical protein [Bacilli bacterium]